MKRPIDTYNRALVPEHLTKQTIESIPLEKPYYIAPGERDDFDAPTIFVGPDRQLMMARGYAIDMDDAHPYSPLELVGVMHVVVIKDGTSTAHDAYVADLRFIEDNSLVDLDQSDNATMDQEEYMRLVSDIEESITFDAFIAPEKGGTIKKTGVPSCYYGDPSLYSYLDVLKKRGDKLIKRYLSQEANPSPVMSARSQENEQVATADKTTPPNSAHSIGSLAVQFSNR